MGLGVSRGGPTLDVQGDAVGEDLLVVARDAGERLPVRVSAGHQDVVALDGEGPVRVPVLAGAHFSRHAGLPPARVNSGSVGADEPQRVSLGDENPLHLPDGTRGLPVG